jgi:glycosyltransferase involved in cell wall biosynthesis
MTEAEGRKPRVLVFCDYYLPGFKGGGPITTLKNMVAALAPRVDLRIVTRNNDLGETAPYAGVTENDWTLREEASVLYTPGSRMTVGYARAIIRDERPDAVYLNSVLSRRFSLFPLIAAHLERRRAGKPITIVVAPRGEFSPGALSLKPVQKLIYLRGLRGLGLWRSIVWQASSPKEAGDIRSVAGSNATISIAPDLPASFPNSPDTRTKAPGQAVLTFVGRVSPMKNLNGLLELVSQVKGRLDLVIVGPIEDAGYWELCKARIDRMPANVRVSVRGPLAPDDVLGVLRQSDIFFLPSLGENFGHVVLEALGSGCPVVLSDRTPWQGLTEAGVGFAISLDDEPGMISVLQHYIDMGDPDFAAVRKRARDYAGRIAADETLAHTYLSMFGVARA